MKKTTLNISIVVSDNIRARRSFFFILISLWCFQVGYSQEKSIKKKTYNTQRTNSEITIDGNFDEKDWGLVKWGGNFVQKEPKLGMSPSQKTEFKIIYDSKALYVAVRCFDKNPKNISAPYSFRDGFNGDWIEINIDSDFDKDTAFSFAITAAGMRGDEYIPGDGDDWNDGFNPNWNAKSKIDSKGWRAEMKIPLKELKIKPGTWGIQLTRRIGISNERSTWQPLIKGSEKWVSLFGYLVGITGVENIIEEQYNSKRLLSKDELNQDITELKGILQNYYPSLYQFSSKESIDATFEEISKSIRNPISEIDFFKLLHKVFSKIGDGHSKLDLSEGFHSFSKEKIKKLPFEIQINNNQVYVTNNFSERKEIPNGTRIIAINGIPIDEIIGELKNYVTSDGYNETIKHYRVADRFRFLLSLIIGSQDDVKLDLLYPNQQEIISERITLVYDSDIRKEIAKKEKEAFTFNIIDSIGKLNILSFDYDDDFEKFIDSTFTEIENRNIKNLIIDLRDNGGGYENNGVHLYSYLTDKPFQFYKRYEVQMEPNQDSFPYTANIDSYETPMFLSSIISKDKEGRNVITDFESTWQKNPDLLYQPKKNSFKGNLYVLVNGGSFSATAEVCSLLDSNDKTIFIGEETGGGYYGNTSGISCNVILPNSKLRANLPLIKYVLSIEEIGEFGRGIVPDLGIVPNANDIFIGRDRVLDSTLEFIKNR